MASTRQSPIMVEQPSSPPHSFASPDFAFPVLSPSTSDQSSTTNPSASSTVDAMPETHEQPAPEPSQDGQGAQADGVSAVQAPATEANEVDDSSNSESNSESSTSTETPGTISTPRSSAQDSGQPVPESSTSQLSNQGTDETTPQTEDPVPAENEENNTDPPTDTPSMPPPPIDVDIPVIDTIPDWVKYDEDTSVPDADEMKEIEADKNELDATNTTAVEKDVFANLDDPDLRPCKKIRLSWIVKGVRGTKERPNRARIMTSPAVCVDGKFWNIKFFPRGNKSRNSLAAFVRCSPVESEVEFTPLEGSFKCFQGLPEVDLSKTEPILDMKLSVPEKAEESCSKEETAAGDTSDKENKPKPSRDLDEDEDDDDDSISGDEDDRTRNPVKQVVTDDFRVSAQLGIVIYNPDEPRTCYTSSVSHQFYPHQDDWGSDPAVSQYEEIHRRKRGQRQALLRNDTLAIDAYIRIYDDPTQALFWHSSGGEAQWDSKGLAGYFPMGTRLLYHSPATAGIAAYALLAPFRKALQQVNAGAWRKDTSVRPRPLTSQLQLVLFQMRHMKKEELYVHLDNVIREVTRSGESFDNVNMFWETFRRAIEIEAGAESPLIASFEQVFGARQFFRKLPLLPVKDVENFQESANKAFEKASVRESFPNFLPLTLQRQSFDAEKRQWRLHNDRVRISEEIDLSRFSTAEEAKFTLYGLIVHDGDRTSGKFFSVLRPTGPGGKWLTFSDGSGNKVFSLTKKRVLEYEGLDVPELKKSTSPRQTIHTALYIRTSCLEDYLPHEMEPFRLPNWLKPHLDESYHHSADYFEDSPPADQQDPVTIEIFWDKIVGGQEGKLDLYKLKSHPKARTADRRQVITSDRDATISEIHGLLASQLQVDEKAFKLWGMNYHGLGGVSKGYMNVLRSSSAVASCLGTSEVLTLWLTMVPGKHELTDEILQTNFRSLVGKHVEAPPKPVIEVPPSPDISERAAQNPALTDVASTHTNVTVAATDSQMAVIEASTSGDSAEGNVLLADSTIASAISTESGTSSDVAEEISAPDAEQESVSEAVRQTLDNTPSASVNEPAAEATEREVNRSALPLQSPGTEFHESTATGEAQPPEPVGNIVSAADPNSERSIEPDTVINPESPTTHVPSPPEAVSPGEPSLDGATPTGNGIEISNEDSSDNNTLPVVHGHLFEASSHGEGGLPVGIPIAIGNERIILVSPNQEDISAEDAALITSMITADIEAAERERQAMNGDAAGNDAVGTDHVEIDSRPSTPRQRIADIYGFLHVFDANKQKFTAHSTFMVPADTTISAMVRKQLQYDEERSFHLWKRDGTYRTTGVSLESTFMDVSLSDCCEVIVGDHLGEKKMEALKADAMYVDPGQLMRYLAMVERGHPIIARTSPDVVEIAEFGGDFYRGPLVRGQRHGDECSLITQSGDTYEGPLVAGQKSGGTGKMTYQNGDVYNGGWLDDQKHGQGEFVEKRTGNRYVGGYENDKRWGKGTTYWQVADQQAALCQVCYFEEVDALFYRCGHVVACYACAKQCASDSNGCPVCRKPIEAVVKMYRS